jgi:EAL and modified HD-GYP domain-containing signal transduction protein
MQSIYIGRQPILDIHSKLVAHEILYRDGNNTNNINNDRHASASVINSILNRFGTHTLLGDKRGFIKIDQKFLMSDIIFSIPNNFFVFAVFASVEIDEKVRERFEQLKEKGYSLAINDITLKKQTLEKYALVLEYIDYVKVNFNEQAVYNEKEICEAFQKQGIKIVATKIENKKIYAKARAFECDLFQGYFFAKPKTFEGKKIEPNQMNILKLYNLLIQDVNIDEITQEFENNPEISIQLLQFINSGAFHFRNRISSLHHVLMLVGRVSVAQWLMLMIYSKSVAKNNGCSPIMLMVKNRTELMERILKILDPSVRSNALGEAYMVGVLSLTDTIFEIKLELVLERINISNTVSDALLHGSGKLGEIFHLVKDIEVFDTAAVAKFEQSHNLPEGSLSEVVFESIKEVQKLENPSQD